MADLKLGTNTINSAVENARSVLTSVGRAGLHTLAPDNIEYYFCSLELLDSVGSTAGFMTFVVMPNNILESKTQIATVTKTNKGITNLFNSGFNPREISLQGTFGRKFRLLLDSKEATENKTRLPFLGGNIGLNLYGQNILVKSGYGLMKMMSAILATSWKLDAYNKPHILLFHNYALNTHYIVEALQDSYSQSLENNMLWYYAVELKAVAPAYAAKSLNSTITDTKRFLNQVTSASIAKGLGNLIKDVVKYTKQDLNKL